MNFTDIFIKRPVFATVLSLIILLIGSVSYFSLPLREFPNITATVINVNTTYPGANAQLIEGFITTPLETAISEVNGIDYVTSNSSQGRSNITVQFKLNYDMNTAVADINSAVASARKRLPDGADDPIIEKQDPNAQPVVWIAFTSNQMNPEDITDYLKRVVQPALQTIDDVSKAQVFGEREYAMRIWLDPGKMAAQNITIEEISQALQSNNLQMPTGQIKSDLSEYSIIANTGLNTEEQFNQLVIPQAQNAEIKRVQDIGYAELGAKADNISAIKNGEPAIYVGVIAKSTGNPLTISAQTKEMFQGLQKHFPKDLDGEIVWDNAKFIKSSIEEVQHTIIEATIIVILIVFLFLGSFRTLTIIAVSIPLSLIGAFGIMALLGFSVNGLTLLALVLAIGMVVDDAIVVSENIHRHIEKGRKPKAAAIIGAREIQFAVIAMTLILAAVFAPIGFMPDLTGILFREFAFTLAGAVIVSGFIALTLSPMMCSKLLRERVQENRLEAAITKTTNKMSSVYRVALLWILRKQYIVIIAIISVFICIGWLYKVLPEELAPKEDIGAIITIMNGPSNANIRYTEQYSSQLDPIYKEIPEARAYGVVNGFSGVNSAISFLILTESEKRKRTVDEITMELFPKYQSITGMTAFPINPYSLPGTAGFMPIGFVLQTTGSYENLQNTINKLVEKIGENPNIVNVDTDLKYDKADIKVDIDRDRSAILGVSMNDIGLLLSTSFGKPAVSQFDLNGRAYDVIPQLETQFQNQPEDIGNLMLRTVSGELVSIKNLVSVSQIINPRQLNHFQQLRSATLTAAIIPGYTLGEALAFFQEAATTLIPEDTKIDYAGQSRQFIKASSSMQQTFIFALIFVFLILAAQFESFRSPLIVMFTVPLALLGALTLIKITGGTINIYTQIGIVTLVGLISKHGILMVEFANQQQELKELTKYEAIVESAIVRFRPILMTTMAMILAAIPLALATGAGAESRSQMGWTIVGGMTIGTIFTLFVVPVIYIWIGAVRQKFTTGESELDDIG